MRVPFAVSRGGAQARELVTGPNPYRPAPARILRITEQTSDARLFELRFEDPSLAEAFVYRPGQFVELYGRDPGATVNDGTAVYDIADLSPLYADVQVPERQISQLGPGQTVRLMTDDAAASGVAQIERIAPAVDPTTGTVKVTLAVRRAGALRPGSFVRVGIVTDTHDDALIVPRPALVAEGRRWHIYRVDEVGGSVEQLEVELGFEEGERVEIAGIVAGDGELAAGQQVVVVGASALSDGAVVRVADEETTAEEAPAAEDTGPAAETAPGP